MRLVRKASGYFAILYLQSPVSVPDISASGHPLGIDVGLEKFLATSDISTPLNVSPERSRRADGELIERPKFLTRLHSKLKLTSDPAASQAAKERASYYNVDLS